MRSIYLLTIAVGIMIIVPQVARCEKQPSLDVSMFLHNFRNPFVSRDFAVHLGQLVMSENYVGVTLKDGLPEVQDKGDAWWVTFGVERWPDDIERPIPMSASQITIRIRKKDAAIVGFTGGR